jgi:hypothetical protein
MDLLRKDCELNDDAANFALLQQCEQCYLGRQNAVTANRSFIDSCVYQMNGAKHSWGVIALLVAMHGDVMGLAGVKDIDDAGYSSQTIVQVAVQFGTLLRKFPWIKVLPVFVCIDSTKNVELRNDMLQCIIKLTSARVSPTTFPDARFVILPYGGINSLVPPVFALGLAQRQNIWFHVDKITNYKMNIETKDKSVMARYCEHSCVIGKCKLQWACRFAERRSWRCECGGFQLQCENCHRVTCPDTIRSLTTLAFNFHQYVISDLVSAERSESLPAQWRCARAWAMRDPTDAPPTPEEVLEFDTKPPKYWECVYDQITGRRRVDCSELAAISRRFNG